MSRARTATALSVLLGLFILRVAGQMLVGLGFASFFPDWNQWYSGLLPYPWLLASQVLIILVFGKACADVSRGRGFFARPRRAFGLPLVVFGWIYVCAMVLRYAILRTHGIPILFHFVLAAFVIVFGTHHRRASAQPLYD